MTFLEGSEARTFTNSSGQTIVASVESVDGDYVEIRRADGRRFTIRIDSLSKEDQEFLESWGQGRVLADERRFLISVNRKDEGDTKVNGRGTVTEIKDGYYKIEIENRTGSDIKDVEIKWFVRVERTDAGALEDRKESIWSSGVIDDVSIDDRAEKFYDTDRVELKEVSLMPGWKWTSNAPSVARDRLGGIYLAIYHGGELVREYAMPSGVLDEGREYREKKGK